MVGFLVLSWLLVLIVLTMLLGVNELSYGTFMALFLGSSAFFLFFIIRAARKKKAKAAAGAGQPDMKPAAAPPLKIKSTPPPPPQPQARPAAAPPVGVKPAPAPPQPQAKPAAAPPVEVKPAPPQPQAKPTTAPPVEAKPAPAPPQPQAKPAAAPPVEAKPAPAPPQPQAKPAAAPPVEVKPVPTPPQPETKAPSPAQAQAGGGGAAEPGGKTAVPVASEISRRLALVRDYWFAACLAQLETYNSKQKSDSEKISVIRPELASEAEIALKASQVFVVEHYLSQLDFFTLNTGLDFQDRLRSEIFSAQQDFCSVYVVKLKQAAAAPGAGQADSLAPAARDLAAYVASAESRDRAAARIEPLLAELAAITTLETAAALGDQRTASKIGNQLSRQGSAWIKSRPK